jgi:PIN domain nuclease of toxin-antitoxin system
MAGEPKRIGKATRRVLASAAVRGGLRVSPISAWEVGMLVRKGRLELSMDCAQWVEMATGAPGFGIAALTADIAAGSAFLPGEFAGDPADRMLVATARAHQMAIVTADRAILRYAKQGHVLAHDCSS